jgi:aldehyde:ferredoxin oxidoreductase
MTGNPEQKLMRVNMTDQSVTIDNFPDDWKLLGGRGLSARILLEECDATCDPLGPDNILVLAPGVLSGSTAPTSGRISVGCKSPLTNGIKEANAGGNAGQDLMKLGYRAIIVTGQPADMEKRWGLEVTEEGVKLVSADDYKDMWNYASCEKLFGNYPKTASAITIGPAGERMYRSASVGVTDRDKERRPARHAARGGVGAVMGSKCLKWVLVDPAKAKTLKPADSKAFAQYHKEFSKNYLSTRHASFKNGTSAVVPIANMLHTFPYKNRTEGRNPHFEGLDGAKINASFETNGGSMHNCMTGCIVKCSNIVHDTEGNYVTSALEFETLTLLGSCCDINRWEDVADLDRLCDELGMDTIEVGAAIAILMDAGGMEWGDAEGAKKLLREDINNGTEIGEIVAHGAVSVGKAKNHARVPVAKGQAIPAWDPRPLTATGITYAVSPMGADHTAGLVVNPEISGEAAVVASQEIQIVNAVCDTSGFCMFLGPNLTETANYYSHFFGEAITPEQLGELGWQILQDEWAFNDKAGFTAEDDDMPACIREEGIGPDHSMVFDCSAELIATAKIRQPQSDSFLVTSPAG